MTMLKLAILFGVTVGFAANIGAPLGRAAAEALTARQMETNR